MDGPYQTLRSVSVNAMVPYLVNGNSKYRS
jgi:hypothetical protein